MQRGVTAADIPVEQPPGVVVSSPALGALRADGPTRKPDEISGTSQERKRLAQLQKILQRSSSPSPAAADPKKGSSSSLATFLKGLDPRLAKKR